jgi:hypothetical protein
MIMKKRRNRTGKVKKKGTCGVKKGMERISQLMG